MPQSGEISYVKSDSGFYQQRSKKLNAEETRISAEAKNAEEEAKRVKREEEKLSIGPAAKISISQEARNLEASHQ